MLKKDFKVMFWKRGCNILWEVALHIAKLATPSSRIIDAEFHAPTQYCSVTSYLLIHRRSRPFKHQNNYFNKQDCSSLFHFYAFQNSLDLKDIKFKRWYIVGLSLLKNIYNLSLRDLRSPKKGYNQNKTLIVKSYYSNC